MTDSLQDVVAELKVEAVRSRGHGLYFQAEHLQALADRLSALAAPVVSDEMVERHIQVLTGMRLATLSQEEYEALNAAIAALSPGRSGEESK